MLLTTLQLFCVTSNEMRPARTYWLPVSFLPVSMLLDVSYRSSTSSMPLAGYMPNHTPCSATGVFDCPRHAGHQRGGRLCV